MSSFKAEPIEADFLLIAEDNPADVGLIQLALRTHGISAPKLHIVQDGEAAIRFIEQLEADSTPCPSLAIFDLNLPRIGGDQVLRRLRASEKWRSVPVIIVSSSLSPRDREDAIGLGASAYFSKPSDLEQFLELGSLIKIVLLAQQRTE